MNTLALSRPGHYRACPATRGFSPGRAFPGLQEALDFARQAADRYRVPYVVWVFEGSAWRIRARFEPGRGSTSA
jgi:hypothetical protein